MRRPAIATAVLTLLASISASAQSAAEVNSGLQFNHLSPGAYSLGMGGAFIGGADDATAAYANPAGLVNIARPEVSVEMRMWRNDHVAPFRGHAFGPPSQEGIDTIDGIEERRFPNTGRGLAFASIVYPFDRFAVALYQHELAHHDNTAETQGIFFTVPGAGETGGLEERRQRPTRSELRLRIVSRGAAFGYRVNRVLSLGFDVSRSELEFDSRTDRYHYRRFFAPEFTPDNVDTATIQRGRESAIRFSGGLTWDLYHNLRIGAVYRREPSFPVTVTTTSRKVTTDCTGRFHLPDVYGAGVSYRPTAFITLNADYNRVRYSELTEDFVTFGVGGECATEAKATSYVTRDGNEYHVGGRYVMARASDFLQRHPIIFTAGWWREAPHAIEHTDQDHPDSVLFQPAGPAHHASAGVGIMLNNFWQVSVGADISRRQRIVSISTLSRW